MNKRQRKYLEKRKAFKKRNKGFQFTQFVIEAPPIPMYESGMPTNAEPEYFKNFALMMPTKAIKMPTKKELKRAWYRGKWKGRIPTFHSITEKPWQRKVGGYSCPPPPESSAQIFGYEMTLKPMELKFATKELEEEYKNTAYIIQYDSEGRPIDSVQLKNIQ